MTKKTVTSYQRTAAQHIELARRLNLLEQSQSELATLFAKHLPAASAELQKIGQKIAEASAAIQTEVSLLILSGHGPKGVQESAKITSAAQNEKFMAKAILPVRENPASAQFVQTQLEQWLALNGDNAPNWIVPTLELYGDRVLDGNATLEESIETLADGIYLIEHEQGKHYTLRLSVGAHVVMFSPATGTQLLSYSDIEGGWIAHQGWPVLSQHDVRQAVVQFFRTCPVSDQLITKHHELRHLIWALSPEQCKGVVESSVKDGVETRSIAIDSGVTFNFSSNGEQSQTIQGETEIWTHLTYVARVGLLNRALKMVSDLEVPVKAKRKPRAIKDS